MRTGCQQENLTVMTKTWRTRRSYTETSKFRTDALFDHNDTNSKVFVTQRHFRCGFRDPLGELITLATTKVQFLFSVLFRLLD